MPAVGLSKSDFDRVFGSASEERATGRSRRCNTCGGWHRLDQPWPHNCREPAPPRNRDLAMPQIAPPFVPFRTGETETAETINSRADKVSYMDKHDLVEWDTGITPDPEPTDREYKETFVRDMKRFIETDPLNIEPADVIGRTDLNDAPEVDTSGMEVFDG